MPTFHFIGLMSGTSLDGVDGVLASLDDTGHLQVLAHDFVPFDATFRRELLSLNQSGPDELHRSALAGNTIARHYAKVVDALLHQTGLQAEQVSAIDSLVAEIASSAEEQAHALALVSQAVSQMDSVTQQNAAMSEESTAANQSVSHEADRLRQMIAHFRISNSGGGGLQRAAA